MRSYDIIIRNSSLVFQFVIGNGEASSGGYYNVRIYKNNSLHTSQRVNLSRGRYVYEVVASNLLDSYARVDCRIEMSFKGGPIRYIQTMLPPTESKIVSITKQGISVKGNMNCTNLIVGGKDIDAKIKEVVDANIPGSDKAYIEYSYASGGTNIIQWSNGIQLYATKVAFTGVSFSAWGNALTSGKLSMGYYKSGYRFIYEPAVCITNSCQNGGWINAVENVSASYIGDIYVTRPGGANTTINFTASVVAVGRWK